VAEAEPADPTDEAPLEPVPEPGQEPLSTDAAPLEPPTDAAPDDD
jgi:hypothetical protein